jgi:hypothetical protein
MDEAWEALQVAIEAMLDARCVSPLRLMCIGRFPPFPGEVVASMCGWQGALTCGGVCGCSGESSLLGAVEEAKVEAEKHGDRSEKLLALVAEAREMLEQAKAEKAERARVAEEAATVGTVKRQQLEERLAALALEVQQVQADPGRHQAARRGIRQGWWAAGVSC